MKILVLVTILLTLSLSACGPECSAGNSRCYEESVQVCSSAGVWTNTQYCESVMALEGTPWMCCPVPEDDLGPAGHACQPSCEGGAE